MPIYQTSITIDASSETIWKLLSTVVAWPRWLPTVTSVEPLDGEILKRGHRFRVLQPKLRPATWIVSTVEPNRRFEWRARAPGVLMVADHVVESLASDATSVVLRFEFRGVAGNLLGLFFSSTTKRYIEQEAASLKAAAEHETNRLR
jgi:uncharacterized membrane protein